MSDEKPLSRQRADERFEHREYYKYQDLRELFYQFLKKIDNNIFKREYGKEPPICEQEMKEWIEATKKIIKKLDEDIATGRYKEIYDEFHKKKNEEEAIERKEMERLFSLGDKK
jgi:hypothetical protein